MVERQCKENMSMNGTWAQKSPIFQGKVGLSSYFKIHTLHSLDLNEFTLIYFKLQKVFYLVLYWYK